MALVASYEEIKSAANSIKTSAEDYKSGVDAIYTVVDNLSNDWKGVDNVSFAEKVNSYKNDILALGSAVANYAKFLDVSVKTLEETQNEISSAATKL